MRTITIQLNADGEYRVPGTKGTEASAYYTDWKDDAIATANMIWGACRIKIKRVEEHQAA